MITALALFDDDDDDHNNTGAPTGAPTEANDEVSIEVERWKAISLDTLVAYKDKETLMINEFAFMWAKRKDFPLHYFVFKQTASHLPHEGNVEQIFSLGGRLSDPNMNPSYLASLVFVGSNRKVFMLSTKAILQRYLRKFSKNGKLLDADLGLVTAGDVGGTSESHAVMPAPNA